MTSDEKRRLLELAAKAAGYPVDMNCEASGWYANGYNDDGSVSRWWNPLDDDGDALRLAVVCELDLVLTLNGTKCSREDGYFFEEYARDPYAAARLAIVRAAAAIGESLP